jgi:hypothetical protein
MIWSKLNTPLERAAEKLNSIYQRLLREKGVVVTLGGILPEQFKRPIAAAVDAFYNIVIGIHKKTRKSRVFLYQGRTYEYFYRAYQRTWRNERAVEIPVVWAVVEEHSGKNILEVGNVLAHYFDIDHTVLDKYEKYPGVINEDVVEFKPSKPYDLIVSISTLEHVGWDETNDEPGDPLKFFTALENLRNILTADGEIVATWCVGFNPELDRILDEGRIPFYRACYLKRISRKNEWIESDWDEIRDLEYKFPPFPHPNGLVICYFKP